MEKNSGNSRQSGEAFANFAIPVALGSRRSQIAARQALSASVTIKPATLQAVRRGAAGDLRATGSAEPAGDLAARAERVAAVAAEHAAAVDTESRFPAEAIGAARAEGLLGAAVPRAFGGEGASISDVVDICYALGRACASTAMIYAMHQTKVACLTRHTRGSTWHEMLLRRLAGEQLLLASSTTEGERGGDVRNSTAAIERHDGRITLERLATVISYAEAADGIVTTARRSADAMSTDQVLAVFLKGDYTLGHEVGWNALGMRGTCSSGFKLRAAGAAEQILPVGYDEVHARTMMPVAHVLWSGAWAGIAAAAVDRARAFVRQATHRSEGKLPPSAAHLTRASASLQRLRSLVAGASQRFELAADDAVVLESVDFQTGMNLCKVNASELAVATVMSAMQACGLAGYRNDGDFSVGRHLRDILSSPIMINNDRILANLTMASLLSGAPSSVRD
jgi:acyl-CoA dehydrogenase